MENGNLKSRLEYQDNEENYLTSNQRVAVSFGISKGIRHIHRLKIDGKILYHRDIKPENILLDGDLQPKVNSFHECYVLCMFNFNEGLISSKERYTALYVIQDRRLRYRKTCRLWRR